MLRSEESQDRQFDRYVELGRDNRTCIYGMRRWCRHVELEPTASGLYAQFTGLPIGAHSVSCPYVNAKTESMNVRWIVSNFLAQHCAGCPHHSPNGDVSWGQQIIDEHVALTERARNLSDETDQRIQQLRAELREKSVLFSEHATAEARSVLEFLEAVFSESEQERSRAVERITQAASIGADLFPDEATRLVATLARTPEYSEDMLPVCAVLGPHLPDLAKDLIETALTNIENGLHVESSAAVLASVGDAASYPLDEQYVRGLILSQDHHPIFAATRPGGSNYLHSTSVLVRSFDADPESVTRVVCAELENELEQHRHNTCSAVALIQQSRPNFAIDLLDALITSLKLHESDETGYEPSSQIRRVLRRAFKHDPSVVDKAIAAAFTSARPAVQEDLAGVYQRLQRSHDAGNESVSPLIGEIAANRLLEWVRDERLTIQVRQEALRSLESTYRQFPARAIDDFGALLGYLAIVSAQDQPPDRPAPLEIPGQTIPEITEQLERQSNLMRWNAFKSELARCLTILSRYDAAMVLQAVTECLDHPFDEMNEEFKVRCVSVLGDVAANYELRPRAIPYVWRALMDYGSPSTRAQAIEAAVKMFGNGISPPANLVEMVMISLTDNYVVVHLAALRAVIRRSHWFEANQIGGILARLASLLDVYGPKKYLVDEISDAIMRIPNGDPRYRAFALKLIAKFFPTGEEFIDRHIAEGMLRFCEPTDATAGFVAKCLAVYLSEHERDRLNNFGDSEREDMINWMRRLPTSMFYRLADELLPCALKIAARDVWEACELAAVFAHYRLFRLERQVLSAALDSIPDEPRRGEQRRMVRQLLLAAETNASLQVDEPEEEYGPPTST